MKITDKRMFTPEGDLREEVSEGNGGSGAVSAPEDPAPGSPSPEPPPSEEPRDTASRVSADAIPGKATFSHLVAYLAEPAAIYLGDVGLPDGRSAENLDLARFHIDLLDLLKQRTSGSLSDEESAGLEELLYSLRLRYVQKRG